MAQKEEAKKCKARGNEFFKKRDYSTAIEWYTKAIRLNPTDHVFHSNRSACYMGLQKYQDALEDAEQCIAKNPRWGKGYYRKGVALMAMERFGDAANVFKQGLGVDSSLRDLHSCLSEAQEKAKKEAERKSKAGSFDSSEDAKLAGNEMFKMGRFDESIRCYSTAIDLENSEDSPDAQKLAKFYGNRAACHLQSRYEENNLKALLRRAQAREGIERFTKALEDYKAVMELDPSVKMASMGMSRCTKAIQEQKKWR